MTVSAQSKEQDQRQRRSTLAAQAINFKKLTTSDRSENNNNKEENDVKAKIEKMLSFKNSSQNFQKFLLHSSYVGLLIKQVLWHHYRLC